MRPGFLPAVLFAVALSGCGGGKSLPPIVKVGGTVTLDDKPLSEGSIHFHPADQEGAASTVAPIVDGKYSAPAIPKGSYRVSFSVDGGGAAPTGPVDSTYAAPAADPKTVKKNPIPEKYRKPSLPADVTADNPALNFDLKSN